MVISSSTPPGDTASVQLSIARLGAICAAIFVAIFLWQFLYHWHHQARDKGLHLGDFPTFYLAAQYARAHRDIYTAETQPGMIYVYPPLTAVACVPLTWVSLRAAGKIWLLINTLCLSGSLVLGAKIMLRQLGIFQASLIWPVALLATLLGINELRAVLTMGETDAIMLFMFTLALYWLDERPALAGTPLALAFSIKYLPIVVIPYLLLRRRWKTLGGFVGGIVVFSLAPAALLGWRENLRCLRVSFGGLLNWVGVPPATSGAIRIHDIADDLSISLTSGLARVLGPRGFSNLWVMVIACGLGVAALLIVWATYRRAGLRLWNSAVASPLQQPALLQTAFEWCGLIVVALAFSPDTNTRHLVLAALLNCLGAALLVVGPNAVRWPAAGGLLVIMLSFIMPGGREAGLRWTYYHYSIPGIGLLSGYFLILSAGLAWLRARHRQADEMPARTTSGTGQALLASR